MSTDVLAEIRVRFRERALADADTLSAALKGGDNGQIEALAHGLAGAAGIFGFTDVSALAKAVDQRFADGETPSPAQIEALIAAIRRDMTYS
ncbi:MAG: hypothetical protein EON85_00730 [Brevundimonas sp.]|nr:MAG: hypothetical protein EON85_00730 [Brevundimonas sp.]